MWLVYLLFDCVLRISSDGVESLLLENCSKTRGDTVDLTRCNLTHLDSHRFEEHGYLNTLDMSRNWMFRFPPDGSPFLYSPRLMRYYCEYCGITEVYELSFSELPQLKIVNLRGNQIDHIHTNAFEQNWIESLILAENNIVRFNPRHELSAMQNLWKLDVSDNEGFELNELSLDLHQLAWLACSGCGLKFLSGVWFRRAENLKILHLDNNSISQIPKLCFSGNGRLKSVSLSDNPLRELDFDSDTLERLHCRRCSVEEVGGGTFNGMPSLKVLDLNHNQISHVEQRAFENNTGLQSIILDHNRLTYFPEQPLKRLLLLKILCVDQNPLHPTAKLSTFKHLYRILGLRQNCTAGNDALYHFEHFLPDDVPEGAMLYHSDLPQCNKVVNLGFRNVTWIHPLAYVKCSALRNLNMDHNGNYSVPVRKPFLYSAFLQTYSCLRCAIEVLYAETFSELPQLIRISLSKNRIKHINSLDLLARVRKLQIVELAENDLLQLPSEFFMRHTALTQIDVSGNYHLWRELRLPALDQNWLEILVASSCGLVRITSITLTLMPSLQKLDVSNNPLKSIAPDAFRNNPKLLILVLHNTQILVLLVTTVGNLLHLKHLCMFSMDHYALDDDAFRDNNAQLGALMRDRKLYCEGGKAFVERILDNNNNESDINKSSANRGNPGGVIVCTIIGLFVRNIFLDMQQNKQR